MARLAPKLEILRGLFALSGNQCAFPGCTHALISDKGTFIAEICHIEAANKGGERYNPTQTDEERRSFENLLLLCLAHHRETDDVTEFPVPRLKQIKKEHEDQFRADQYQIADEVLTKALDYINIQLDKLLSISEDTNTVVHGIQETLVEFMKSAAPQTEIKDEKVFSAQLEAIKELRKQAKLQTVIIMLLDFKEKNWADISGEIKYKVLANIGTSYLEMHDTKNACIYLLQIQDINYETPESLSFLVLGYALAKQFDSFDATFKKVLKLDKENINAWVAYIERYRKQKKADEIRSEIPAKVAEAIPITFSLAGLLIDEGRKKEGIALLKKTLERQQDDPEKIADTKALIATRIMQIVVDPVKYIYRNYLPEELAELEEAKVLLTDAWNTIGETELAKSKYFVVMNRGVIYKITGKISEAILDFQKAFDLSKEFLPFKNLLFAHLQQKNLSMANHLMNEPGFKQPLTESDAFEFRLFKGRILCLEDKIDEAIEWLKTGLDQAKEERYKELITDIIAIYFAYGRIADAAPWCEKLVTEFPGYITGYLMSGLVAKNSGDNTKALQHYEKAQTLLLPTTPLNEVHELASGFTELEQYEKAIPFFERLANKNLLTDFTKGLVHCYYHTGDFQAALAIADNLFSMHPDSMYLAEIISNIYQDIKQYDKAITTIETFLPFALGYPKDVFLLNGAKLHHIKKDDTNTRRLLLAIEHPEKFSVNDAFVFAWLLVQTGEVDKGLQVALEARSRFFDNSAAHKKYITVCFAVKRDEKYLFPDTVREDCAVKVRHHNGDENLFLITAKNIKGENVLSPSDPFALQLIGKPKGEIFTVTQSYGVTDSLTIIEIKDIYTHAVHETMGLFKNRFAGEQGIGVFEFDPENPLGSFEQVLRSQTTDQKEYEKQLYEQYKLRRATLGVLAGFFKRNAVMQWYAMQSSADVSLIAYTQNEVHAIEFAISSNKPVIIELTALLTWFIIVGEKQFLPQLANQYIISQSTIDELQECYDELERSVEDGMLNLAYEAGRVIAHQTPKETITRHRELLQKIINWCKEHALILTPNRLLSVNRNQRQQMANILGDCFYDTILLAEEHEGIVVSDDDNFKNLLRNGVTPLPFSVYQFMQYLRSKEKIDAPFFDNLRLKLIRSNYIFIPVTGDQLWECFDNSGFQLGKPFTVAVKGLLVMRTEFSALHVAHFLKRLYLQSGLATTREQTILFILNEISARQDFDRLKQMLILVIGREFRMLPNFKDDILQLLNVF
ncbi:MAG: hypothetical protein WDO71_20195 [Bacteroidota bacterium]